MTNSGAEIDVTSIHLIGVNVILRPWQLDDKQSLIENANNRNV
jgi:hypothetical protein